VGVIAHLIFLFFSLHDKGTVSIIVLSGQKSFEVATAYFGLLVEDEKVLFVLLSVSSLDTGSSRLWWHSQGCVKDERDDA
jgi:hypothetical protein